MASNLRVDQITASTTGSVSIGTATFTGGLSGNITGLNVTGVITATTLNQNVTGVVTATGGFVVGTGATISGSTNTITASTNGSERLRITSGGNVGIGTDNPYANAGTNLHIHSANTTSEIRLTNSTTGGGLNGSIVQQGGNTLYISNSESGNTVFENAGSERARITSTGNVQIANGNLVFSTSGTGIDFSATADGSGTTTSELLDDYEEGTFTPSYNTSDSNMTGTFNPQGRYTKIGNIVHVFIRFTLASISSVGTGNLKITGLPFTSNSVDTATGGLCATYLGNFTSTSYPSGFRVNVNSTTVDLYKRASADARSQMITPLVAADLSANGYFDFYFGTYYTS